MKRLPFILLAFILCSFFSSEVVNNKTVKILEQSRIGILGSTNVNSFECKLNVAEVNTLLKINFKEDQKKIFFDKTALHIDVSCFDCGNNIMNSDFRELLQADIYPEIVLELKEIVVNPKNEQDILAYMAIHLAGKSRMYSFPLKVEKDHLMHINGCLNLRLSDFEIEAPKKALGLIVVSDEIEINIDLRIKTY